MCSHERHQSDLSHQQTEVYLMRLFYLFCSIDLSSCLAIAVRIRDCNYTLHSSNTSDCIDAHGNQSTAKLVTETNHLVTLQQPIAGLSQLSARAGVLNLFWAIFRHVANEIETTKKTVCKLLLFLQFCLVESYVFFERN